MRSTLSTGDCLLSRTNQPSRSYQLRCFRALLSTPREPISLRSANAWHPVRQSAGLDAPYALGPTQIYGSVNPSPPERGRTRHLFSSAAVSVFRAPRYDAFLASRLWTLDARGCSDVLSLSPSSTSGMG